jgi:hypothetical protein
MWVIASTTCLLYLLPPRLPPSEGLRLIFRAKRFARTIPHILNRSHTSYLPAYEDGTDSVPKRWYLNYRRRGITQKKAYDIFVLI